MRPHRTPLGNLGTGALLLLVLGTWVGCSGGDKAGTGKAGTKDAKVQSAAVEVPAPLPVQEALEVYWPSVNRTACGDHNGRVAVVARDS